MSTRSSPHSSGTRNSCAREIAHQINLKFAPDVRFKADSTFDKAARIDALLRAPEVRRDLVKQDPDKQDLNTKDDAS